MTRQTRLTLALVAGPLILAFVAVMAGWESWATLSEQAAGFDWRVRPLHLVGALSLGVAALLLTGRIWAAMFRDAGGEASPREATAAWIGSNLGRYLPGKVWQLAGITAWFKSRGDSGAAGFGSSLGLQAVMLATGAAVGLSAGGRAVMSSVHPLAGVAAAAVVLACLHPRVLRRLVTVAARMLDESPPERALDGRRVLATAVAALGVWLLYGLGFRFLVAGLAPEHVPSLLEATGMFAASYVAGYVVLLSPGGLVVREGALAFLLSTATGLPGGAAAAVAVAARIWTTLAELAAFAISAIGLRIGGARG